jgi:multidrug efflux pump
MSREEFVAARDKLLAAAEGDPALAGVRLGELPDVQTLQVDIDQPKLAALGLNQADVNATLSAAWGGQYVNDFIDRGRVKRVFVQADAPYRATPDDIGRWFVRGDSGQMAPFSSFARTRWSTTPTTLSRFQGYPSFQFDGQAAPGESSGAAMDRIEALAKDIPGVSVAWSGLSFQERLSSGQAPLLYALSLAVVFLSLAALYESWAIPAAVMLAMPLGVVGALGAALWGGFANDVFFQVALLTVVGLTGKNAILIVEFARARQDEGEDLYQAVREAARQRLRPIVMTSMAFSLGVTPLVISSGAGAGGRNAIGAGVLGGTISATILGALLVPLFYVVIRRLFPPKAPIGMPSRGDGAATPV